jgi:hypothetical protein
MRSQRRHKQPFTRESLRRSLEHHRSRGTIVSYSEPTERSTRWWIQLRHGDAVEFTEAQLYALCCGLASALQFHDSFVARLGFALDAVSEPLCDAATSFSCTEAESIETIMVGLERSPQAFIDAHARGDEWGDAHYRGACGACGQILEPGEPHDCDLDPRSTRGRHVLEATELFRHAAESTPDIASFDDQVTVVEGWPGEIVGS